MVSGRWWVKDLSTYPLNVNLLRCSASQSVSRIANFLGQIPWLGAYLGYIPGVVGPLNMLLEYAQKEMTKRLAEGSSTRDLFYYLVRTA